MKDVNLFIIKNITENIKISDKAFMVWCGLRSIMEKDESEYFVSYNLIACRIYNRAPNRTELNSIKTGFNELVNNDYIKILYSCNKTEHMTDLSALYYSGEEFFANITLKEMQTIMNISGNYDKCKMLRYFCCQVGSFNWSTSMGEYRGKIGGMGLEHFEQLMPINKSTVITFNRLLEENHLLFVIRHKDFYQGCFSDGTSNIREIPNTYSRWCDKDLAIRFAENLHGYKYFEKKKNVQTAEANHKRSLGQKLNYFIYTGVEYSDEEMKELREYAEMKNAYMKKDYEDNISKGYSPAVPDYIDMSIFDAAG